MSAGAAGWRLRVLRRIHWWPPLLGAGVKVTRMDADYRAIDVEMRLTVFNRNVMGSHFGGSLYAMTDPFYMLMLMENLGREYIVWDKAATIRYKRPGIGTVRAEFRLSEEKNPSFSHSSAQAIAVRTASSRIAPWIVLRKSASVNSSKAFIVPISPTHYEASSRPERSGVERPPHFAFSQKIAEVRDVLEYEDRYEPVFLIEVKDEAGRVVCEVEKTIYCAKRVVHEQRRRGTRE